MPNASTLCDDRDVWLPPKLKFRVPHPTILWLGGRFFRILSTFVLSASIGQCCFAQPKTVKPSAPAATKRFCQKDGDFCFSYPASWSVLGEAFGDGVVIAPRQTSQQSLWNVVTVVAMPEPADPSQSPGGGIDQVINNALAGMRAAGHTPATLERQQRTVAGLPGQMIRVRYHDEATGRDWVEQLVFAEGPERELYSASLKAQPADFARLQPVFESILRSWKLQPEAATGGAGTTASSGAPPKTPHNLQ